MLLDDLVGVIETLKERIAAHGASLRENETRTRMALIDPLLQALGWDVSDPIMVTPEYSVGASRADYALLTSTGNPSALVEAKKLDESLASHRMQMLNYANISGIPHAGLTDGNHWEMYTVFDQAPIEQRRILDVSIASTPAHEAALKLLLLWRPNLASGQPVAANAPAFTTATEQSLEDSDLPKLISKRESDDSKWIPLSDYRPSKQSTRPKRPIAIRFPSGEEHRITRWSDVLVELLGHLIRSGRFTRQNCPWVSKPSGVKVNTTPFDGNGLAFASPKEVSDGIYVEIHGTANAVIRRCLNLLNSLDIDPATVKMRID